MITLSSDPVSVEETFFAVLPVENRFTTDTGSAESDGSTVLAISQTVGRYTDTRSVAASEMFKVSAIRLTLERLSFDEPLATAAKARLAAFNHSRDV